MRLLIEVELGNDAMRTAVEVSDAITKALIKQSASALDPLNEHEVGTVRDTLGNTVGKWEVVG